MLWACFQAIGHTPPIAVIVLAYQIGYLANVLPIPGNIGVLEGSFVGMFVLYGVSATPAAAAAVVYHAIALWIPADVGHVRLHPPAPTRPRAARARARATSTARLAAAAGPQPSAARQVVRRRTGPGRDVR